MRVGGRIVGINSDFRLGVSIDLECGEADPDIPGLLLLFYNGSVPPPVEEAAEEMIRFFAHQEEGGSQGDGESGGKRAYDFAQDADALMASFLDTYGLDLSTAKIHWWTFKRLLCNLPAETPFMRRLYYRTADMKKMSKAERKHVEKMRRLYALKRPSAAEGKTGQEMAEEYREKMRKRYEEAQRIVGQAP